MRWSLLLVLGGLGGCGSEGVPFEISFDDVSEVGAGMAVGADGMGSATASVSFVVGSAELFRYVPGQPDERLTVTANGVTTELGLMTRDPSTNWYEAVVPDHGVGASYLFEGWRADGERAFQATAVLPPEFVIAAPAEGTRFSRAHDDIVVEIRGDTLEARHWWHYELHCPSGDVAYGMGWMPRGADGAPYVQAGWIIGAEGVEDETCSLELTIDNVELGMPDPAFREPSDVRGVRSQTLRLESVP